MADSTVDPPPSELAIPPFDASYFSEYLDQNNDVSLDDFDFDFDLENLCLPDDILNPTQLPQFDPKFSSDVDQLSGPLNASSTESNGWHRGSSDESSGGDAKGLNWPSPISQGSGNCRSDVSDDSNYCANIPVTSSSPNLDNVSIKVGDFVQKSMLEDSAKMNNVNSSLLKRKKGDEEDMVMNNSTGSRSNKNDCNTENNDNNSHDEVGLSEEEKRKARLIRNRESAQLSRQRKKQYVEVLEDKVKAMDSMIQDLNVKISYFMAENATLRQQMGSGGGAIPPLPMATPPPGMYPHPAMMYPWMPYMVKPQGSQVPLVPIPRLKRQKPTEAPKVNKKVESKKNEGRKTKKVAGVSFLGLLFFIMLFGGLVPMVNVRYGGVKEAFSGGFTERHHGRVLMVNGTNCGEEYGDLKELSGNNNVHCGQSIHDSRGKPSVDEVFRSGNGSEPLAASLYVTKNNKLVKIDGNLVIHSVLASEKAMSAHGKECGETGLAVPGDLAPAIRVAGLARNVARHPSLRALGSGSADEDSLKSLETDGKVQQWFHEGLTGPLLTSGMCTKVFEFDVSSAIVPVPTSRNISGDGSQNSTLVRKVNRRILRGLPSPLPESSHNISAENAERNSGKEKLTGNNTSSPMVVSVLVDPKEAGDADIDGVTGSKSISRIFVVVLIDSVKYVTYSCILPFMGSATPPHL